MFRDRILAIASVIGRWRRRVRPYDRFSDGSSLTEIHRYAIRYQTADGRFVDIGFDADISRSYVWVIRESTLAKWTSPPRVPIDAGDKARILERVVEYCDARKLRYVIEP
jgi:hypothetical protein